MKLFGYLRKKSALHRNRRSELGADPKALGQLQPEPIQEDGLLRVRPHHAAEAEFPPVGGREDHIGTLDAVEFREDRTGALPEPGAPLPLVQRLPEDVRQEADQDVCLDPVRPLVPDGAESQLTPPST